MKKITLISTFFAFAFSFLGTNADAQSANVEWDDRIGPHNNTIVINYSNFGNNFRRRIYRNTSSVPGFPNWVYDQSSQLTYTSTSGVDTIRVSYGGDIRVKILDQGLDIVLDIGMSLPGVLDDPVINVIDLVYGNAPSIMLRVNVIDEYGIGRPSYYQTRIYCYIWQTYPATGWSNFRVFEAGNNGFYPNNLDAHFELPDPGEYQYCWYMTDEDESQISHFGETEIWSQSEDCPYITWDFTTGIVKPGRIKDVASLQAFPNPFTDLVVVSAPARTTYQVFDMTGRAVTSGNLTPGENRLDFQDLIPGYYILRTDFGLAAKITKQ